MREDTSKPPMHACIQTCTVLEPVPSSVRGTSCASSTHHTAGLGTWAGGYRVHD